MKKRFSVLCSAVAVIALLITVIGFKAPVTTKYDVSNASVQQCYDDADDMNTTMDEPVEDTTASGSSSSGILDGLLGGLGGSGDFGSGLLDGIGGVGGIFGDAGDVLGSLGGSGSGNSSNGTLNTTVGGNPIYIDPVPAATQPATKGETLVPVNPDNTQPVIPEAETIDPSAVTNPYARPVADINPGDMGDGVKWIQWNIIYSGYALQGSQITGIYDDATVEAVKKLQTENGFTADGVVNDATRDKIERLYYDYVVSLAQTTAPAATIVDTTSAQITDNDGEDNDNWILWVLIGIIALIWIGALVVILIIVKKSKSKKKDDPKTQKPEENKANETAEKPEGEKANSDMSLEDLFEEANNNKK